MSLPMVECASAKSAGTDIGLVGRYGVRYASVLFRPRRESKKKNALKGYGNDKTVF